MAIRGFALVSILVFCLASTCYGSVLFGSLKDHKSLIVKTTNLKESEVLNGGESDIILEWSLGSNVSATATSGYKTVKAKLCYAPISQVDRAWRKTKDDLKKDKTCQFNMFTGAYKPTDNTITYKVEKKIPTATYFVRVYVYDSNGAEVAYGQSTNDEKKTDLFNIKAISGRHTTLDICSVVFSCFSIVSLFGFFYMEKRQAKNK